MEATVQSDLVSGKKGLIAIEGDFEALAREFQPAAAKRMEPVFKREVRRALGRRPRYPRKTNRGAPRTKGVESLFSGELTGTSTEEQTYTEVFTTQTGTVQRGEVMKDVRVVTASVSSKARTRDAPHIPTVTLIERGRRGAGRIAAFGSFWSREGRRVGYRPPRGFNHVAIAGRKFLRNVAADEAMRTGLRSDYARAIRNALGKGWVRPSSATIKLTVKLREEDLRG